MVAFRDSKAGSQLLVPECIECATFGVQPFALFSLDLGFGFSLDSEFSLGFGFSLGSEFSLDLDFSLDFEFSLV